MFSRFRYLGFASFVALFAAATPAAAQSSAPQPKQEQEPGYSYAFADDPLVADGFLPAESRIQVRSGPARIALIRPRVTFVPQMLKSVENL